MAAVSKNGTPSPSTVPSAKIVGLVAGDTIAAGDLVYINSSGVIVRASGAAANAAARVRGMVFLPGNATQVDALTIASGVVVNYGSGLTPGTDLYLSGSVAGGLDTATSTGGTTPVAFVIDAQRIFVLPLN